MNATSEKWWFGAGAAFTALGLSWMIVIVILAGALTGAVLTMFMTAGEALRVRLANAAAGVLVSLVATPAVGAYMEVKLLVYGVLAMVIALWGLAALREVNDWVKAGGLKSLLAGLLAKLPKGGV